MKGVVPVHSTNEVVRKPASPALVDILRGRRRGRSEIFEGRCGDLAGAQRSRRFRWLVLGWRHPDQELLLQTFVLNKSSPEHRCPVSKRIVQGWDVVQTSSLRRPTVLVSGCDAESHNFAPEAASTALLPPEGAEAAASKPSSNLTRSSSPATCSFERAERRSPPSAYEQMSSCRTQTPARGSSAWI